MTNIKIIFATIATIICCNCFGQASLTCARASNGTVTCSSTNSSIQAFKKAAKLATMPHNQTNSAKPVNNAIAANNAGIIASEAGISGS